jgi:hypothetical protein
MKNTTIVNEVQHCHRCKLNGFFVYTPQGADYSTCPCCGSGEFLNTHSNDEERIDTLFLDVNYSDEDMRHRFSYCEKCKILFTFGCVHNELGCTDSVYNAHFIQKWRDKTTMIVYDGMPQFESNDEWYDHVNDVEVLKMYCPHIGAHCYKMSATNREYVSTCSL